MSRTITIATRKSKLALWQSEFVANALSRQHPGLKTELLPLSTRGDEILDRSLSKIGGKGLFLKELEQALLDGRADIAVHSMKDVPAEPAADLMVPVVMQRDNPLDALISSQHASLASLPAGATVGTSSLRRQAQLLHARPDLRVSDLRGNINTRIEKLDAGEYDAILLAAAGLERLGMEDRITELLPESQFLPAVAQGVLGIECRRGDSEILDLIRPLNHRTTGDCVMAERAFNLKLGGSCQTPIAAHATLLDNHIRLTGLVSSPDGKAWVRQQIVGPATKAASIGISLAGHLLSRGADRILAELESE